MVPGVFGDCCLFWLSPGDRAGMGGETAQITSLTVIITAWLIGLYLMCDIAEVSCL